MSAISLDMVHADYSTISLSSSVVNLFNRSVKIVKDNTAVSIGSSPEFDIPNDSFTTVDVVLDVDGSVSLLNEAVQSIRSARKLQLERTVLGFLVPGMVDDSDAEEVLDAAVPEAMIFISKLPANVPLPSISLALDGIITLEWDEGGKKAAAMFEGDDEYGYTYLRNGRFVPGELTAHTGAELPVDLEQYLTN